MFLQRVTANAKTPVFYKIPRQNQFFRVALFGIEVCNGLFRVL